MKFEIDKDLLPMKAHYFLFNAGTAPVVPFMPTLARQLGFSTVVVGTMYTILPIIGMLAKPFFGFIADRYQRHRLLFLIAEMITGIAFFLIMFIPPIPQPLPEVEFSCNRGLANFRYCSTTDKCLDASLEKHYGNQSISCTLNCAANETMWDYVCKNWLPNKTIAECSNRKSPTLKLTTFVSTAHIESEPVCTPGIENVLQLETCLYFMIPHSNAEFYGENITMSCPQSGSPEKAKCSLFCDDYLNNELMQSQNRVMDIGDVVEHYQFWLFFGMLIISWIGMAVVVSIGDAICFAILGERHHLYGNQRLYGSIGWGLFSIIAGVLVDKMSGGSATKDYTVVFWMTAVLICLDVRASSKLKHTQTHLSPNILKDVGTMFLSLRCVIFFIWCVAIGLCTALIWNFLFWHLEDLSAKFGDGSSGSVKTLEGLAMGIQCFGGELPFFFISGWVLKKIGHVNAMSLVLFCFGVRFMLYSVLINPWYVLPIELMNGVTFGIFYSTMASYASIVAPAGTEATMQGLVGAIFEGVGVSLGSLVGGILYSAVGGAHTFEIFGVMAFIVFIVHVVVQMWLQYRDGHLGAENGTVRYLAPTDAMHMLDEQEYHIVS